MSDASFPLCKVCGVEEPYCECDEKWDYKPIPVRCPYCKTNNRLELGRDKPQFYCANCDIFSAGEAGPPKQVHRMMPGVWTGECK